MKLRTVEIVRLTVEPHPVAGVLDIVRIGQSIVVVCKGKFRPGDLAAFIPENALVPAAVLVALGMGAMPAGTGKTRVKAVRLGGVLSQGLLYPVGPSRGSRHDGVISVPAVPVAPVGTGHAPCGAEPSAGHLPAGADLQMVPLPVRLGQDVSELLGITFETSRSDND